MYDDEEYHHHDGDGDHVTHPPLVGFGFDGYSIFGRHTEEGLLGEFTNLDHCGGHDHDGLGYHYHAHTEHNLTTDRLDGVPPNGELYFFSAYYVAPTYCWHGNVDVIENFWQGDRQVNYDRSKTSSSADWSDYEELRPCCESEHYYVAGGLGIAGLARDTSSSNTGTDGDSTAISKNGDSGDSEGSNSLESGAKASWSSLPIVVMTALIWSA